MKRLITGILGKYLNTLARISGGQAGKQAFYLFCYPFAAKLKPHQLEFLGSAEESAYRFEGKEIRTYTWGQGPETILCLHGWQSNSFRWKKYIEELDHGRYTVIALDAPGHGKSEGRILNVPIYGRLIRQYLDEVAIDHILGHSIGCFAAMYALNELQAKRPRTAVFLGAPGTAEEFIDVYREMLGLKPKVIIDMEQFFIKEVGSKVSDFNTARYALSLTMPGLIVHDVDDLEAPYHYAERLHALWPSSRLITTNGFGHKLRDPSVIQASVNFITEHSAQAL